MDSSEACLISQVYFEEWKLKIRIDGLPQKHHVLV